MPSKRQSPPFFIILFVGLLFAAFAWLVYKVQSTSIERLKSLRAEDIAAVTVYIAPNTNYPHTDLLYADKGDKEAVRQLADAINQVIAREASRDDYNPVGLYLLDLEIALRNGDRLGLRLYQGPKCGTVVYVDVIQPFAGGFVESSADLYAWLRAHNLLKGMGCN